MDKQDLLVYGGVLLLVLIQYKDTILGWFPRFGKNKNKESNLLQKVDLYEKLMNLAKDEETKQKLNELFPLLNKETNDA